jgi:NAD(P)-dependent dehydrogenase (short-subunit alcohol dehydrogenase family)
MHHHPAYGGTSSYKPDNMSVATELHPVIHAGRVALITGAASGIGYAAAIEFAKSAVLVLLLDVVVEHPHRLGLKIAIADCDEGNLAQVGQELTAIVGESNVLVIPTDVSKLDQVVKLRDRVYEAWGEVRTGAFCWQSCLLYFRRVAVTPPSFTCFIFSCQLFDLLSPLFPDLVLGSCSGYVVTQSVLVFHFSFPRIPTPPPHPRHMMFAHLHTGRCAYEQCWSRRQGYLLGWA